MGALRLGFGYAGLGMRMGGGLACVAPVVAACEASGGNKFCAGKMFVMARRETTASMEILHVVFIPL